MVQVNLLAQVGNSMNEFGKSVQRGFEKQGIQPENWLAITKGENALMLRPPSNCHLSMQRLTRLVIIDTVLVASKPMVKLASQRTWTYPPQRKYVSCRESKEAVALAFSINSIGWFLDVSVTTIGV